MHQICQYWEIDLAKTLRMVANLRND